MNEYLDTIESRFKTASEILSEYAEPYSTVDAGNVFNQAMVLSSDIDKLLRVVRVQMDSLKEYEMYDRNPGAAARALTEADKILSGGGE